MKRICSSLLAILLFLGVFTGCVFPDAQFKEIPTDATGLEVHFIDVGQADAALILCDGEAMLIDGGNVGDGRRLVTYLNKQGIKRLNAVVCTHGHEDHVGGLAGVLSTFGADAVFSSTRDFDSTAFENFKKYAEKGGRKIQTPSPGDSFFLGNATVQFFGPLTEYEEENDNSIVLKLTYGEISFLFTGDAERIAEEDMLAADCPLDATVLKVGHHGSSSSTSYAFLRRVAPEYAVISCETGNSYGHPHDEVLSRLRDAEVTLYRTDLQGDVIAKSNGKTVSFETAKTAQSQTNPTAKVETYIGNIKSRKFHTPACESLPAESNRIAFETREDALSQGYTPCGGCKP